MTVDYLQARIGLDVAPFKRGMDDAVSSARRGAAEIAIASISASRAGVAVAQSVSITSAAMQVASGNVASTISGTMRVSREGFAEFGRGIGETGTHVDTFTDKLGSLSRPIATVIEGFAAFEAARTVWSAFNEVLEDTEVRIRRLNEIAKASRELGTGTTFLTQLIAQAGELGVKTETLTTMLEKAREATRVKIGEGNDAVNESAFQARARQHVAAGNLTDADLAPYNAATSQEQQIRAVLDLLERLKAEQRELAANDLGRTFFGADFEGKARQGIDLIGAFRRALDGAKAEGSGLAPTSEEIARAEEFRQREEAIAATIRDAIAPAVHDFNDLSDAGKRTWIEWEERVAGWVKWLGEGYLKVRDIAAQVKKMAQDWGLLAEDGTPEGGPLVMRVKPRRETPVDKSNPLPGRAARAAREPQDPDSVANVIRSLEKARDLAEAELRTVGLSNVEKERAVDLAKAEAAARGDVEKGTRASAELTAEETRRIMEAADATAQFKDRQKDLEQQLRNNAELARYFGDTLASAIGDAVLEGKSLGDVLTSLEKQLARGALQAFLTGSGPLASLLGTAPAASAGPNAVGGLMGGLPSLFGGGGGLDVGLNFLSLAEGGHVTGPGTGTSDSIPTMLSNGEFVVNAKATAQTRPFLEALNSGRILHRAAGGMIEDRPLSLAAGTLMTSGAQMSQAGGQDYESAQGGSRTMELHLHGGADQTRAESSMGSKGPRLDLHLDNMVAMALMQGSATGKALKNFGVRQTGAR